MSDMDDFKKRLREEAARAIHEHYCVENKGKASAGMAIDGMFDLYERGLMDVEQTLDMISSIVAIEASGRERKREQAKPKATRDTQERAKQGESVPTLDELEAMLRDIQGKS